MPNRDGTGPDGKGSKTGRGMGNCAGAQKSVDRPRRTGEGRGQRRRGQK